MASFKVETAGSTRPGMLVRLRPSGPWRIGTASGARDRVDSIFHSDTLYSAVTHAMRLLGRLEYWLEVTARRSASGEGAPLVRFSSMFPFFGDTLYVAPPRHVWPPAPSNRVLYSAARFVPLSLVESIFAGKPLQDDRWTVDGVSECLVPSGKSGPFRVGIRSSAAVDRLSGASEPFHTACLEFLPKSGFWFSIAFSDQITRDQWNDPLRSAIRLLSDTGFGGERSRGWGRAHKPEFREGPLPQLLYKGSGTAEQVQWTLSLVSPARTDQVEWDRGSYSTTVRGGRVESPAGSGAAKKLLTMIEEGSVLHATTLEGSAPDVAPEGFDHPVFHAGWAFTIPVPVEVPKQLDTVESAPMDIAEVEVLAMQESLADEIPPPDAAEEALEEPSHMEDETASSFEDADPEISGAVETADVVEDFASPGLAEPLPPEEGDEAAELETIASAVPEEIDTPDEELEQLQNQDSGGPNDDIAPPMNDPGPMEPPFSEPLDITPIDPDPGPGEKPPGPNPDEPAKPEEPQE